MDINDVAYEDRPAYQQFVYVVASRHARTGPWLHKKERRSGGTLVMNEWNEWKCSDLKCIQKPRVGLV